MQVFDREQAVVCAYVRDDALGDLAAIEGVDRGLQAMASAVTDRGVLRRDQEPEGAREIGIGEQRAHRGHGARREIDRGRGRPRRPKDLGAAREREVAEEIGRCRSGERRMHRKSRLGELERRGHHVAERERAGARQDREQRMRCRRRSGGEHTRHRNERQVVGAEPLDGRGPRGLGVAVHGQHAPVVRGVDERGELAAERVHVGIHQPLDERRGDGRVDRVAARVQHPETGLGREIVLGHDHPAWAHERGALAHGVVLTLSSSRVNLDVTECESNRHTWALAMTVARSAAADADLSGVWPHRNVSYGGSDSERVAFVAGRETMSHG